VGLIGGYHVGAGERVEWSSEAALLDDLDDEASECDDPRCARWSVCTADDFTDGVVEAVPPPVGIAHTEDDVRVGVHGGQLTPVGARRPVDGGAVPVEDVQVTVPPAFHVVVLVGGVHVVAGVVAERLERVLERQCACATESGTDDLHVFP
jgi:hypothetical protein